MLPNSNNNSLKTEKSIAVLFIPFVVLLLFVAVTSAFWKFKNGAIGTLMHGLERRRKKRKKNQTHVFLFQELCFTKSSTNLSWKCGEMATDSFFATLTTLCEHSLFVFFFLKISFCSFVLISLQCRLSFRLPHSEAETEMQFASYDTYYTEDKQFLTAVTTKKKELIQSPYSDAFQTYQFTWAITNESRK
jgi:flagellar basal body-associated protein FliL